MICRKCKKTSYASYGRLPFCIYCESPMEMDIEVPDLPLRGAEKRPATAKRKMSTDAQKAVQKATNENQSYLFGQAWKLFHTQGYRILGLVPEYKFHPTRNWLFDWAFLCAGVRIAVEVDGGQWKPGGGRHGTDGDRDKLNEAAALGWLVLRFSPKQLRDDPEKCVRQVERALRLRGEAE